MSKPSSKEEAEILGLKVGLENEHEKLEKARLDPDPNYLTTRQKALNAIKYDLKLDMLISLEEDLLRWKNKKREAEQNFDKASKNVSKDAAREIAENTFKQQELLKKIGAIEERIADQKVKIHITSE